MGASLSRAVMTSKTLAWCLSENLCRIDASAEMTVLQDRIVCKALGTNAQGVLGGNGPQLGCGHRRCVQCLGGNTEHSR